MSSTTLPRSRPATLRGDHDPALHVLAQHHVRPFLAPDVGQQPDRNRAAIGRVDRQVGQPIEIGLRRRIELHDQVERRRAIEDPSDGRAGEAVSTASATSSARRP